MADVEFRVADAKSNYLTLLTLLTLNSRTQFRNRLILQFDRYHKAVPGVMGHFHSLVTSQPKTIGYFTAYPNQIEFDFGHFTAYYLLVGVCCPRGFDLCCEFDFIYRSGSNKNCDIEI